MTFADYREVLAALPFGKRLPDASYIHRMGLEEISGPLRDVVATLLKKLELGDEFNVIKFHRAQFRISFLAYPDFFETAHPTLTVSVLVDLANGRSKSSSFDQRGNPPILHRKEEFLPADHPDGKRFRALTRVEEEAGLYENPRTIGFLQNWLQLLEEKGCVIQGHTLTQTESVPTRPQERGPKVDRHKTAMVRYDLSKPVKTLLEYGVLRDRTTFFDYGCGRGSDVEGLAALGHQTGGWDPVHRPDSGKAKANIVNLGYVINVIEDPVERVETLIDAWEHAESVLVVSALVRGRENYASARPYKDGLITQNNTFQRYYDQTELQGLIESALHRDAIPVALGIFYVFRSDADQQDFLSRRSRRVINWGEVTARLGFERPAPRERKPRRSLYERHQELLDEFWAKLLELGRLPHSDECERLDEVRRACASTNRALALFNEKFGSEAYDRARESRREDLLVYLALEEFKRRRTPYAHLSASLRRDLKEFFGPYQGACEMARELLFAAGDPGELELAAEQQQWGFLDHKEGHYTFHRSLLDSLAPVLRVYVGCGAILYGDPAEADLIKIHLRSGKLTLMTYQDFEGEPLPALMMRVKIDLRRHFVSVFDYSDESDVQLLYFKERYLEDQFPGIENMRAYGARLRKLGLDESNMGRFGPTRTQLVSALDRLGYTLSLNKKEKVSK